MHDIDVIPGNDFSEVFVAFDVLAAFFDGASEVFFIDVADSEQLAGSVDVLDVPHAHATGADDGASQCLTGWSLPLAPDHVPRHNADGGHRCDGGLEEFAACGRGHTVGLSVLVEHTMSYGAELHKPPFKGVNEVMVKSS